MILKNISKETLIISVNWQKVEISEWVLFSIDDKMWTQLLNMYPNKLSQQVVITFNQPLELEEEEWTITTEWEFEWQLWVLDHELYSYLNKERVKISPEWE